VKILYHILYPAGIGDDRTIYDGYRYAFKALGHEFLPLTEREDLATRLAEVKPDLFMGSLSLVKPSEAAPILKRYRKNGGKVLLRVGWLEESHQELIRLIREDMLADIYVSELELPQFKNWTGKEVYLLQWAASREYHFPVPKNPKYDCDIVFIGAKLAKKSRFFDQRLLPLTRKYRVKIFGTGWDWTDRYILRLLSRAERRLTGTGLFADWRINRQVPYTQENQAYASAKISLNFHEEQPGGLRLLNGRTFKIPACGGFELCDNVPLVRKYFAEDEVIMAESDADFFRKVDYYLTHEVERRHIQEKGTARAEKDHMYEARVHQVLDWYNGLA